MKRLFDLALSIPAFFLLSFLMLIIALPGADENRLAGPLSADAAGTAWQTFYHL